MERQIKKRNGEIVEFEPKKITAAISKAFAATNIGTTQDRLQEITDTAVNAVLARFPESTPSVEDVQNAVETTLMQAGFFDVAKAYIIYRYEHTKTRQAEKEEILEKIERNDLFVIKRSGKKEKFSTRKMRKSLEYLVTDLQQVIDIDQIVALTEANLYDGIPTKEISKALILSTRTLIELEPAYSKFAARLLFNTLYKEVIGADVVEFEKLDEQYRRAFIENIKRAVHIGRLDPSLLKYDLEKLSQAMKLDRDNLFMYLGGQTLYDRYFISDPESKAVLETPQAFWMRVAMGLAINEPEKEAKAMEFYEIISTLRFVPSTPTLFHAGTSHPQLSSCYLTTIEDSLDNIFKSIGDNAQLSKWSGGVANDWTNLRATGALIKGTGVESQGVIPFLKIANDTTVAINRSGRRRGATCAYMEVWHMDFEDFLELKKNTGDERRRTHDMNTAAWIPDLFMKRVINDEDWTLLSPDEAPDLHHIYGKRFDEQYLRYENLAKQGKLRLHKTIKAKALWKKMIMMLFETGHPWMTWKDPSNIRSPQDHVGVVHSSNLCTEITLNTTTEETAVCNLGSINLATHITDKQLDVERLKETTRIAMRMLDNVIDINFYPTIEAKNSNLKHRPVGLGIMGFQDALYLSDILFDSEQAVEFADYSQEVIAYHAVETSALLASERGAYASFRGSKWDRGIMPIDTLDLLEQERGQRILVDRVSRLDWQPLRALIKQHGMRNSNCMAIAPTATIANIAGCFPSIEPIYKNVYVKSNMSGEFTIVNEYLVEDLKAMNLWNRDLLEQIKGNDGNIMEIDAIPQRLKDKYKEVFDIEPEWLVKVAAYRGKWIDQSQSLNLFIKGSSGKKISEVYQYAWAMGLKTTYYLRSLGATAIEKSTIELNKQKNMARVIRQEEAPVQPQPQPIIVEQKIEPMAVVQPLVAATVGSAATNAAGIKLCKIADPDCEACQ